MRSPAAVVVCGLLLSWQPPLAAGELTLYYDFEGDYQDQAGQVLDHLTPTGGSLVADVPAAAVGSTLSYAVDNNVSYQTAQTDAFSVDLATGNAYTLMFWFKGDDMLQNNNNTRLMSLQHRPDGGTAAQPCFQVEGFGLSGPNGPDLRLYDPTNGVQWFAPAAVGVLGADGVAANDVWHHVAFVISNTGSPGDGDAYIETFVDGVSVGMNVYPGSTGAALGNTDGELIVGGHDVQSRGATGFLDDVALLDGVAPDAVIAAVAAGDLSPAAIVFLDGFDSGVSDDWSLVEP